MKSLQGIIYLLSRRINLLQNAFKIIPEKEKKRTRLSNARPDTLWLGMWSIRFPTNTPVRFYYCSKEFAICLTSLSCIIFSIRFIHLPIIQQFKNKKFPTRTPFLNQAISQRSPINIISVGIRQSESHGNSNSTKASRLPARLINAKYSDGSGSRKLISFTVLHF